MIYFFADNHFGQHPGKAVYEQLPENLKKRIVFQEDDWTLLESGKWLDDCELLVLNMIGTTCGLPHPGPGAEKTVRNWCERGGNLLLLHGSSAAFWHWDWWRKEVGLRWVRPNDPDNIPASCHPKTPCRVVVAKCRHELTGQLVDFELPEDEVYINLEQMSPVEVLMTTTIAEGTFPQCYLSKTSWNGTVGAFIPGHKPVCTSNSGLVSNTAVMINWLLKK